MIAGKVILDLLKFLSSPAMSGVVEFITGFIKNFFPLIVGGIIAATGGIIFLLGKMVGITRLLQIAAFVFGGGSLGAGKISKGLDFLKRSKIGTSVMKNLKGLNFLKRIKFQEGGLLKGKSHKDGGIPIEAEGGEFFVKKEEVNDKTLPVLQMINSGDFSKVAELMKGLSGDEKLEMHSQVEKFFNDPRNRIYTTTNTDSEGNVTMGADGSGLKRYREFMKESGYEMDTYGYMPNLGKTVEDKVRGLSIEGIDGVRRNVGANTLQYASSNYGFDLDNEINKNVVGTEAFYLNALSQSITEKGRKDAGIKPLNNVSIPGPPVVSDQDANFMLEQVGLPPIPSGKKDVPVRNELPVCSLNPTDSNKCDTLGMIAP